MDSAFDKFKVETFGEFALTFQELLKCFVIHFVIDKELFMGEGAVVRKRYSADFSIIEGVLEFHSVILICMFKNDVNIPKFIVLF